MNAELAEAIGLYECSDDLENPRDGQGFRLRNHRDISSVNSDSECLEAHLGMIVVENCQFKQGNQYFRYDLGSKQIFCGPKRDNICIDMDPKLKTILTSTCDHQSDSQKWNWGFTNETMLKNWFQFGKEISDTDELNDLQASLTL